MFSLPVAIGQENAWSKITERKTKVNWACFIEEIASQYEEKCRKDNVGDG